MTLVSVATPDNEAMLLETSEIATGAQLARLVVRDGRCRFPGCGRTRFLKAHHLVRHADGGPTSLDNMILLCQAHHSLIHKPGWRVSHCPDGHLGFVDPKGVTTPSRSNDHHRGGPHHPGDAIPAPVRMTPWAANVILHNWMRASTLR